MAGGSAEAAVDLAVAERAEDGRLLGEIMKTNEFTQQLDDGRIAEEIRQVEQTTSGEIRVFISKQSSEDPMADARREFHRLQMQATSLRNAVLLYFAPASNRFAVFGDEGIHLRCGPEFWAAITQEMETFLRAGAFNEAIFAGVRRTGVELTRHFPKHAVDRDDLPNAVVRD